jgi:hypothetical protein
VSELTSFKKIYHNKWVELRERDGWVYITEPWCNSVGIALLPYRTKIVNQMIVREYLGRFEPNKAHQEAGVELCSITGGYDNADKFTIEECALNELREEGGYAARIGDLVPLGVVTAAKVSDKRYMLYTVDIGQPHIKEVEATGDGTKGEKGAYCQWITKDQLLTSQDPLLLSMYVKLFQA